MAPLTPHFREFRVFFGGRVDRPARISEINLLFSGSLRSFWVYRPTSSNFSFFCWRIQEAGSILGNYCREKISSVSAHFLRRNEYWPKSAGLRDFSRRFRFTGSTQGNDFRNLIIELSKKNSERITNQELLSDAAERTVSAIGTNYSKMQRNFDMPWRVHKKQDSFVNQ